MQPKNQASLADAANEHTLRVLFVIPRIRGEIGAAYQSTAMRLVNGLCQQCHAYFQMEVLHAPTYERLASRLRQAKTEGKPFHVLHYDGHGAFLKPADLGSQGRLLGEDADANEVQGFLLLENAEKPDFVDGGVLGKLLAETGVLILALNAAHAPIGATGEAAPAKNDANRLVKQAFEAVINGCLAAGLPGALSVPIFSETDAAATFLGDVYAALAQGVSLGEAVASENRYFKGLAAQVKEGGVGLPANWRYPKVYGKADVQTAPRTGLEGTPVLRISVMARGEEIRPERMDPKLLRYLPETGIYGRDELVLHMEQAFDHQGVLLLFGEKGTGKTSSAVEFARWQANNGANGDQPILYTSLQKCANLSDVLEEFGQVYQEALLERHVVWNELEDYQRIKLIQDVCKKVSLLWIWDDYESVSQDSFGLWDKAERDQLVEFMASLTNTAARLLVISNNAEKALEEKVIRVKISPLAHSGIRALICAYLKKHPRPDKTEEEFTQLIECGIENIKALIVELKQPVLMDEDTPTGPPDFLVEGFVSSISLQDQRLITLAALFVTVMNCDVLVEMGNPQHSWSLPEIRGLTQEKILPVLARAGDYGLLSFISGRYYLLDSTLVSCLESLFHRVYPGEAAYAAFANAISLLSRDLTSQWESGDKEKLGLLAAEETNLKRALLLAQRCGCRNALAGLLMGLRLVHFQNHRYIPWARLLNVVAPEFLTSTGRLRREMGSDAVTFAEYCVEVSRLRQRFIEAGKWQELRVDWEHRKAATALKADPQKLNGEDLQRIKALTTALADQGDLQEQAGSPKAIDAYKDGFRITKKLKKTELAANFAYRIAKGYITIPAARDLLLARRWMKKCLSLRDPEDRLGRGQTTALFGMAALEKFMEGQKENRPVAEQIGVINQALGHYFDALDWLPEDALVEMGMIHETIGYLYLQAENAVDTALEHYDRAIKYKEQAQDGFGAAKASFNAAVALFLLTRFELGHSYALKALRGFEALGAAGAGDAQKTRGLIAKFRSAVV